VNILLPHWNLFHNWTQSIHKVNHIHQFFDMNLYANVTLNRVYKEKYVKIVHELFIDSRTYYLAERTFMNKWANTVFNNSARLYVLALNTLKYLQEERPDCIFSCCSTPHDLSWYF